jgi:hypothetical protein
MTAKNGTIGGFIDGVQAPSLNDHPILAGTAA